MSRLLWSEIGVFLVLLAVVGVAIPSEQRPHASQESSAATALKSGIIPAEVQCQAGDYFDEIPANSPGHGVGEYGFMTEISGLVTTPGGITLNLLAPTYQKPIPEISGYRFVIYLPDGLHGAISDPYPLKTRGDPANALLRTQHFVAYTWPVDRNQGRRMFAIDEAGNIYSHAYVGDPAGAVAPAWNALYTADAVTIGPPPPNGTWISPISPDWHPYRR